MIPTPETLERAKEILAKIESLQAELAGLFGGSVAGARRGRPRVAAATLQAAAPAGPRKRRMTAEGRARIAAAAKARWERFRTEKEKKVTKDGGK